MVLCCRTLWPLTFPCSFHISIESLSKGAAFLNLFNHKTTFVGWRASLGIVKFGGQFRTSFRDFSSGSAAQE